MILMGHPVDSPLATWPEMLSSVMTPRVTLAGTQSTSIQKETQEMPTMRVEGRYDWIRWNPIERCRWNSAARQL